MKAKQTASLKVGKIVRVLTVAPIMALVLLSAVFFKTPAYFGSTANYIASIIFLTVLPLLAYPLQPVFPHFKNKGREGQRNLAIVMAVVGYIGGIVYAAITRAPRAVWLIFFTYLFSGIGIVLFNKIVPVRASGHACGVMGPVALAAYLVGPAAIILGVIVLILVFWASLCTKRHTPPQLIYGSLIPLISFCLSLFLSGFFIP